MKMKLSDAFDYIAAAMQQMGHDPSTVKEFLWQLYLQPKGFMKLESYLSVDPQHFEQAYCSWMQDNQRENKSAN
jgi:hypothetical protein